MADLELELPKEFILPPQIEAPRIFRELSYRNYGGVIVSLWWRQDTDEVGIDLHHGNVNASFLVPRDKANDAFEHPYVYYHGYDREN